MADVKKCDRCGTIYDRYEGSVVQVKPNSAMRPTPLMKDVCNVCEEVIVEELTHEPVGAPRA